MTGDDGLRSKALFHGSEDVGSLVEQLNQAARELARAVVCADWPRALEALEERERIFPALERMLGSVSEVGSLLASLERALEVDSGIRNQVQEAREKLWVEIQELDKMTRWARGVHGVGPSSKNGTRLELEG
ncbi:MAG: flagellar protein FliT [Thermodesulfobacteriota bacterium]